MKLGRSNILADDLARLNQLARDVGLLGAYWLAQQILTSYLPDHAKRAYVDFMAHNYDRTAIRDMDKRAWLLAWRLNQRLPRHDVEVCYRDLSLLALPAFDSMQDEKRFMRYVALRDLQQFAALFAAPMGAAVPHLRPWVRRAFDQAMATNHLELAASHSITVWDEANRPQTKVARPRAGLFTLH